VTDDESGGPLGNAAQDSASERQGFLARWLGPAVLVVLIAGVTVWWLAIRDSESGGSENGVGIVELAGDLNPTGDPPSAEVGRAAPDFVLNDLDGARVQLSEYRGQWVLLNFWATWCGPCRQETPDLQRLQDRQADSLVVLGVNMQESRDTAADFASEFSLSYPMVLDRSGEVATEYRVGRGLPVSMLVDPSGVIRETHIGRVDDEDLRAMEAEFLQ